MNNVGEDCLSSQVSVTKDVTEHESMLNFFKIIVMTDWDYKIPNSASLKTKITVIYSTVLIRDCFHHMLASRQVW